MKKCTKTHGLLVSWKQTRKNITVLQIDRRPIISGLSAIVAMRYCSRHIWRLQERSHYSLQTSQQRQTWVYLTWCHQRTSFAGRSDNPKNNFNQRAVLKDLSVCTEPRPKLFVWHTRHQPILNEIYTVFRKKHPLTFSSISPWLMCRFKQKLQWIYLRNGRFWPCRN